MTIFVVDHYFTEGRWSFYPGETFPEADLDARGVDAEARRRRQMSGHIRATEAVPEPAILAAPSLDMLSAIGRNDTAGEA